MDKQRYKQLTMDRLQRYFDFQENVHFAGVTMDFQARMHRRNEKYLLAKKNVLYAYDNFEYFCLYQNERLPLSELKTLIKDFSEACLKMTKPNNEHMSTDHVLILHLNYVDDETKKYIEKYKYRHYFRFGLQGTLKVGVILVYDDAKSAVFSKDLRDKKYHFVLEK